MKDKALKTIKQNSLIKNVDTIIVALSGGADSSALLHFLKSIQEDYELKLYACHLNHNLRGKEADRDQKFCEEFCRELNVPIFVYSLEILKLAKQKGKSTELCAREERCRIFDELKNKLSSQNSYAKVATAHTLSDNVETIIWNMCRGTSSKGLMGIPVKRDYIIRPLLYVKREEIENYCRENEISFVTDSTNLSNDYTRNVIRNRVVPILREINSSYDENISSMSQRLKCEDDFLESETMLQMEKIKSKNGFDITSFLSLHRAICFRIISKLLSQNNIQKSSLVIENVFNAIKNKKKLQLSESVFLFIDHRQDSFTISKEIGQEKLEPYFEKPVSIGKHTILKNKSIDLSIITKEEFNKIKFVNKKAINCCLDCDKISLSVFVRQKKDGDKISLYNRYCTKTLKKLFNEAGLSLRERSRRFVLCDETGKILWIEGFGCERDFAVKENTKNILYLDVTEG